MLLKLMIPSVRGGWVFTLSTFKQGVNIELWILFNFRAKFVVDKIYWLNPLSLIRKLAKYRQGHILMTKDYKQTAQ